MGFKEQIVELESDNLGSSKFVERTLTTMSHQDARWRYATTKQI